jgi:hypothetical protein
LMDDTGNTKTGDYMVFLQRFNNPGNAQAIAFGQTLSAAISTLSEVDAYTFTAALDDRILIRATRTSGTLQPNIGVYNASGELVCSAYTGGALAQINNCTLRSAGQYTLLMDDTGNTKTGNYTLYLECLNAPCGSSASYTNYVYLPMAKK